MIIEPNRIVMRRPDNWHCHWRQGNLLHFMVRQLMLAGYGRVNGMPNTDPPILNVDQAQRYAEQFKRIHEKLERVGRVCSGFINPDLTPVPAIQILEETGSAIIAEAVQRGFRHFKIYPFGVTNSRSGVRNYRLLEPVFKIAEECGAVLSFHAENPDRGVVGREKEAAFIPTAEWIVKRFPSLRIIIEHAGDRRMIKWVQSQSAYVAATLTPHQAEICQDDYIGYSERSGCRGHTRFAFKPTAKDKEDCVAVLTAATSGDPHFFFGGDDAPHLQRDKGADHNCGAFHTIEAVPRWIELFERMGALPKLEDFLSRFGASFHGWPLNQSEVTFVREPWEVPRLYEVHGVEGASDGVEPYLAGERMEWRLQQQYAG